MGKDETAALAPVGRRGGASRWGSGVGASDERHEEPRIGDAGALGAIDEPAASAAIRQVQQEMGWSATGAPRCALWKILLLRLKLVG
jgi:hypothetical protein